MNIVKPIAFVRHLTKEFRDTLGSGVIGTTLVPISFMTAVGVLVWSIYVSYTGTRPDAWLVGTLQMGGMLSLIYHHPMRGLYEMFFMGEFRGRKVHTATATVISLHETTDSDELQRLVNTHAWPYDAVCLLGERYAVIRFIDGHTTHTVCLRLSGRLHDALKTGSELPIGFQVSRDPFLKVSGRIKVKAFCLN